MSLHRPLTASELDIETQAILQANITMANKIKQLANLLGETIYLLQEQEDRSGKI